MNSVEPLAAPKHELYLTRILEALHKIEEEIRRLRSDIDDVKRSIPR